MANLASARNCAALPVSLLRFLVGLTKDWVLFVHAKILLFGAFNTSSEDCTGVPSSRWLWGLVALPSCGRACARLRRGRVGSRRGCWRLSWLRNARKEAPASRGWGATQAGASVSRADRYLNSAHPLCVWEKTLGKMFFLSHIGRTDALMSV